MRVFCLLAFLLFAFSAHAQTDVIVNWRAPGGTTPVTNANPLPISGSFSATLGGFAPSLAYATCTSTASSCSSTALPTNSGSVVLFNTGTTTVSCTLGSGAATALSSELQIPASSGLALATVYSATTYDHFACIDQAGSASNVVVASGGSGLPTGWGGGGGGGGAVTIADGAAVNLGSLADAAWSGSGNGTQTAILKAIYGAAITGAATNGATYPASSIGIGWKDGSGNIQPAAAATPFPITQFLGPTATVNEPCRTGTKVTKPISQAASAVIITHTTTLKTYICGGSFNLSDAESVSITEGTGTVCATGQVALMGSTTVANGMALAANEGMSLGSGGSSNIVANTGGDDICLLQSGTGRAAGWVTYVQQ